MYRAEIKSGKRRSRVRPVQPRQARADNGKRIGHGGARAGAGRKAGSQNVFSREIKEAIIEAANEVGRDGRGAEGMKGYMKRLALNNEAVFGGLLRGVMGQQVSVERVERPKRYETVEEVLEELKSLGIAPAECKELPYYQGPEIELDAANVTEVDSGGDDVVG